MNYNETDTVYKNSRMMELSKTAWITSIVFKWFAWIVSLGIIIKGIVMITEGNELQGLPIMLFAGDTILGGFLILLIEHILYEVKSGDSPFTWNNAARVKKMARIQLTTTIYSALREFFFPMKEGIQGLAGDASIITSRTTITIIPYFFVLVLYVLAFVFEYGVRLQQQADETL